MLQFIFLDGPWPIKQMTSYNYALLRSYSLTLVDRYWILVTESRILCLYNPQSRTTPNWKFETTISRSRLFPTHNDLNFLKSIDQGTQVGVGSRGHPQVVGILKISREYQLYKQSTMKSLYLVE